MVKYNLFLIVAVVLCLAEFSRPFTAEAAAQNRVYFKNSGKDAQAIVIPGKDAGPTEWAGRELQEYLRRITGKEIPVVDESKWDGEKPAILLGLGAKVRALNYSEQSVKPEGFIIKTTDDYLIIFGDDNPAWTPDLFSGERPFADMIDTGRIAGSHYGTLYGVYSFLEKVAGVGWFFPGPLGEVVPEGKDVIIPDLEQNSAPDFSCRVTEFSLAGTSEIMLPEYQKDFYYEIRRRFPMHLRLQFTWKYFANHSMYYWGKYFGKDHPEYFALANGKRSNDWGWGDYKNPGGVHRSYCWANPATIARQIDEMRLFFSSSTNWFGRGPWRSTLRDAYPIGMNDGRQNLQTDQKNLPTCECPYCLKWHNPQGTYRNSMSDLYAYHLSEVAKVAAREFPGKYVLGLAYGATVLPPEKVQLPKNAMMGLASVGGFVFANYHPETKKWNDVWTEQWMERAKIAVIWLYIERLRNNRDHVPLVLVHALADEIKLRKGKIEGFFIQGGRSDFFTDLEMYVATQLMWDSNQDTEEVIDRYMNSLYGPAAPKIKEIYTYLEGLWREEMKSYAPGPDPTGLPLPYWKNYPETRLFKNVFTPEKLKKTVVLAEGALQLCKDNTEQSVVRCSETMKTRERVKRLRDYLKITLADSVLANEIAREKADPQPARPCPKVETAPVIDGTLADPAWEKALTGKMANILLGAGQPAYETKLWVCRDSENLYVAVECAEPLMQQLVAKKARENPREMVFANDDLEIFIDPTNSLTGYYQIGIDAAGQAAAFHYQEGEQKPVAIKEIKVVVEKKEKAWIVEIKIPFSEVGGAPAPGSRWGINIVRNRQAKESSPPELSGWFPNEKGQFRSPEDFGRLMF